MAGAQQRGRRTLPQEGACACVPMCGELGGAGADLHFGDVCIGVPVPPRLALRTVPIEAEAREDEARLGDGPGKVVLEARHCAHHVHHQQPAQAGQCCCRCSCYW